MSVCRLYLISQHNPLLILTFGIPGLNAFDSNFNLRFLSQNSRFLPQNVWYPVFLPPLGTLPLFSTTTSLEYDPVFPPPLSLICTTSTISITHCMNPTKTYNDKANVGTSYLMKWLHDELMIYSWYFDEYWFPLNCDRWTDRPIDRLSCRDARMHLKVCLGLLMAFLGCRLLNSRISVTRSAIASASLVILILNSKLVW